MDRRQDRKLHHCKICFASRKIKSTKTTQAILDQIALFKFLEIGLLKTYTPTWSKQLSLVVLNEYFRKYLKCLLVAKTRVYSARLSISSLLLKQFI